jgi:hypothetical protein
MGSSGHRQILPAIAMLALASATAGAQPARTGVTVDMAVACPKEADFTRYATLTVDDMAAAIAFKDAHGCVTLPVGAAVRIDDGSLQRDFSHVCVRPVASPECFWTYAAHIKAADR